MSTFATVPADPAGPPAGFGLNVRRSTLCFLGAAIGIAVALALTLGAHRAWAGSRTGHSGAASTGFTLCAGPTGALTYSTGTTCPSGDTKLVVGPESQVNTLNSEVSSLKTQVGVLQTQVASLEKLLKGVTRGTVGGNPTLTFSGENVRIVNGTGTEESANGLGNLFVGYNESPGTQTGSHNLVVGNGQSFTSYGGLLAGEFNTVESPFSTTSGGWYNVANDNVSAVNGGCDNIAGPGPVPTGPCSTAAEAVAGGASNSATGIEATVLGGQGNGAEGAISSILGGDGNYTTAQAVGGTVSGGYTNYAEAAEASITGGGENTASGEVSTIAGGYYNTATSDEATILGGCSNLSGYGNLSIEPNCYNFGDSFMAIVGGIGNQAGTLGSTVGGGTGNVISAGQSEAIAGGQNETLSTATAAQTRAGFDIFHS